MNGLNRATSDGRVRDEDAPAPRQLDRAESLVAKLLNWFRLDVALRQIQSPPPTQRFRALEQRARYVARIADRAIEPRRPLENGQGEALACELYRQSIYWALCARRELQTSGSQGTGVVHDASPPATQEAGFPEDPRQVFERPLEASELWARTDPKLVALFAGGKGEAALIDELLAKCDYRTFAELEPSAQVRLAWRLKAVTNSLLPCIDPASSEIRKARARHIARIGLLVVGVAVAVLTVAQLAESWRWRNDLARGAAWLASSTYPEWGCASPQQDCAGPYFFSTQEEDAPWIEFDLGGLHQISRIQIVNRKDCCAERAAPLLVEVSGDKRQWKEVARHTNSFGTWNVRLEPTRARWLRLSAQKRTNLHLRRVRIAP